MQVVTQDTAESLGYVQDLLVSPKSMRVVSFNLKPNTVPLTAVNKNCALSELQQIGDVVLVRVGPPTAPLSGRASSACVAVAPSLQPFGSLQ